MKHPGTDIRDDQALRLAAAVSKLRTGRRDARWQVTDLSITQVSLLKYLEREGPTTASTLATVEHVTPQAVAQQLRGLKERGFVIVEPDPVDRRKASISLTYKGRALLDALLETREAWLARAIEATVRPDERPDLERAIDVLERLALTVQSQGVQGYPTAVRGNLDDLSLTVVASGSPIVDPHLQHSPGMIESDPDKPKGA